MYEEARARDWSPPAAFPRVPTMARLLDPRRRPPAQAVFSRETLVAAAGALYEAEQDWAELPVGGVLTRPWRVPARR